MLTKTLYIQQLVDSTISGAIFMLVNCEMSNAGLVTRSPDTSAAKCTRFSAFDSTATYFVTLINASYGAWELIIVSRRGYDCFSWRAVA